MTAAESNSGVVRILEEGVVALNEEGKEVLIERDTIINAFGMCPNKELAEYRQK